MQGGGQYQFGGCWNNQMGRKSRAVAVGTIKRGYVGEHFPFLALSS